MYLRDVLATVDKPLTVVLEPLGDGKIRVRTSSWNQEVVISADEVLEAVVGRQGASVDPSDRSCWSVLTTSRPDLPLPGTTFKATVTL